MSDIVWAINPRKDSLGNLTQRMRRFATDLLTARGIDVRFDADERDRNTSDWSADKRRHVFLIFKESLNNVVRHAECRHVAIDFRVNHDGLVLRIADDGSGRHAPPTARTMDTGSPTCRRGRASLAARSPWRPNPPRGTTLTLRAPFARSRAGRLIARLRMHTYKGT